MVVAVVAVPNVIDGAPAENREGVPLGFASDDEFGVAFAGSV